jgi:hypothetical protein
MTRTSPTFLVALGIVGAVIGWFVELSLVVSGKPAVIPPVTLGAALVLIGILIVVLALPVFRVVRKVPGAEVDPFYATRVVLLAKASSMSGSLVAGFGLAVLAFLLSRSVLPAGGSVAMAVVTAAGAVILLAGGLVAEKMCTLPPEDDGTKEPQ